MKTLTFTTEEVPTQELIPLIFKTYAHRLWGIFLVICFNILFFAIYILFTGGASKIVPVMAILVVGFMIIVTFKKNLAVLLSTLLIIAFFLAFTVAPAQTASILPIDLPTVDSILNEGNQLYESYQFDAALQKYTQALYLSRRIGDRHGEGKAFLKIGDVYRNKFVDNKTEKNYNQALENYNQALLSMQALGDRQREGILLSSIGLLHTFQYQNNQGLSYFSKALIIQQEIGDKNGEGSTLVGIGVAYQQKGEIGLALSYYQDALTIVREVGNKDEEGNALHNIGNLHIQQQDYNQGLTYYFQALTVREESGIKYKEAVSLSSIASAYRLQRNYDKALSYYEQSLVIYQELGHQPYIQDILNEIEATNKLLSEEK